MRPTFIFTTLVYGRSCITLTLALVAAAFLGACATPVAPTGGPPDKTPPTIVESQPPARAINVSTRRVTLLFSEYVDVGSFSRALSITPEIEGRLGIDWRGRRVTLTFPEDLRPNTTYVLTLDTDLRDAHGVALTAPLTLAFATGPQIDRGRLGGRALGAEGGAGREGLDVFAYAAPGGTPPDSLAGPPDYRTQTAPDGRFRFDYLSEQPYYVVVLQDRNRNRRMDDGEPFAAPPRPTLLADSSASDSTGRWIVATLDATPPFLRQLDPRSDQRLELRFSEPLRLLPDSTQPWIVEDSTTRRPVIVTDVYLSPNDPQRLFVRTPPMTPTRHRLRLGAVADTSGNRAPASWHAFTPLAEADTLPLRFEAFLPERLPGGALPAGVPAGSGPTMLLPGQRPGLRFNRAVADTLLQTLVQVTDTTGRPRALTYATDDGTSYALVLTPPLRSGQDVIVRIDATLLNPSDTLRTRRYRRTSEDELGSLSGRVTFTSPSPPDTMAAGRAPAPADTLHGIVVELFAVQAPLPAPRRTPAAADGRFAFAGLPPGTYRLRAFHDRDGDGRWDGGLIAPYKPAEAITWSTEPLSVRARWDTALEAPLRLPLP